MKITIIDYGVGNLASVDNALEKLGIAHEISGDPEAIMSAQALILPGVGAAGQGMENLKSRGLDNLIVERVKAGVPILGLCLGMQLLMDLSEENEKVECLSLISGTAKKFHTKLKVPQMGWNQVEVLPNSKLLKSIPSGSYFYFVHSYYCEPQDKNVIKGITDYDVEFCSVIEQDNIYGTQFHPEKSSDHGLQLLRNFYEVIS